MRIKTKQQSNLPGTLSAIAKRCPQITILGYNDRVKKITIAKIVLSALAVGGVLTIVAIAPNSLANAENVRNK